MKLKKHLIVLFSIFFIVILYFVYSFIENFENDTVINIYTGCAPTTPSGSTTTPGSTITPGSKITPGKTITPYLTTEPSGSIIPESTKPSYTTTRISTTTPYLTTEPSGSTIIPESTKSSYTTTPIFTTTPYSTTKPSYTTTPNTTKPYKPSANGLKWNRYAGYHNENTDYTNNAKLQALSGKNSSGSGSTDFSNISSATQGNQPYSDVYNYTILWTGLFYTGNNSGEFTFFTKSFNGSYLWLGEATTTGYKEPQKLIVNNGGNHDIQERYGKINLNANTYYPIKILFGARENGYSDLQVYFLLPDNKNRIFNGEGFYFS